MKLLTNILAMIFLLITSNNASATGNNEVWVEPGRSIANIKIDSSYSDIVQLLGPAQAIEGSTLFFDLKYDSTRIEMDNTASLKRALSNSDGEEAKKINTAIVTRIDTFSLIAKTRGRIKIGSTLKEVLDVFGEASPIFSTSGVKPTALFCSNLYIYKYPENNPIKHMADNFSGYLLMINYLSEGISFFFKIDGKTMHPTVVAMSVSSKRECNNLLNR